MSKKHDTKSASINANAPAALELTSIPQQAPVEIQEIKETAAADVARYSVMGFFGLLGLCVIFLFAALLTGTAQGIKVDQIQSLVNSTLDLVKTLAAVLAGIIGAILGYYFRAETHG